MAQRFKTELYRDADGHEVWRVISPAGELIASGIASDHDAAWLVAHLNAGAES